MTDALRTIARELNVLRDEVERLRSQEQALSNARELGGIRRDGPATAWTKSTDAWEDFGGAGYFEQAFTKRIDGTELIVPFHAQAYHDSGTNTIWELGLQLAGTGEVGGPWKLPINPSADWQHPSGLFLIGAAAPSSGSFTLTLRIRRVSGSATIAFDSNGRAGYRVLEVPSGLTWT